MVSHAKIGSKHKEEGRHSGRGKKRTQGKIPAGITWRESLVGTVASARPADSQQRPYHNFHRPMPLHTASGPTAMACMHTAG